MGKFASLYISMAGKRILQGLAVFPQDFQRAEETGGVLRVRDKAR